MRSQLLLNLRRGFGVTVVFFVLLGLAYPLARRASAKPSSPIKRTGRSTAMAPP